MRHSARLALFAVTLAVAVTVSAQTRPTSTEPQRFAVVVGIGKYQDPSIPPLRYAGNDATAIYKFLIDPDGGAMRPDNVRVLIDEGATTVNLRSALGTELKNRVIQDRGDMVFIFFAGHGAPEPDSSEPDLYARYLLTHDTKMHDLFATAINMSEIDKFFARVKAQTIVLALDTCYSGAGGGRSFSAMPKGMRTAPMRSDFLERLASKGRAILAAADSNEQALEVEALQHGLFTYHLLQGMRGAADTNNKGYVTLNDAYLYVHDRVTTQSRELRIPQTPKLLLAQMVGPIILSQRRTRSIPSIAPPPAPKPQISSTPVGSLVVSSEHDTLEVFLDGERLGVMAAGRAMTITNIAVGTHVVTARRAGFSVWTREIAVTSDRRGDVYVRLEPLPGAPVPPPSPTIASAGPPPRPAPTPAVVVAPAPLPAGPPPQPAAPAHVAARPPATTIAPARVRIERSGAIIGIGSFDHGKLPRLRFAERDARAMYDVLLRGGAARDGLELLTDATPVKPTFSAIKRALGTFIRKPGKDDTVIVYYAGHGAIDADATRVEQDGFSKYLVPRDADPEALFVTGVDMEEFQSVFTRSAAGTIVLFLDTAFGGATGGRSLSAPQRREGRVTDDFLDRLTRTRGRIVIAAAGPNEVAAELPEASRGLFTHYVVKGLDGEADADKNGAVTLEELFRYVETRVVEHARRLGVRQRPVMKGSADGDVVLSEPKRR